MKLRKAIFYTDGALDMKTLNLIESGEYYILTERELEDVFNRGYTLNISHPTIDPGIVFENWLKDQEL